MSQTLVTLRKPTCSLYVYIAVYLTKDWSEGVDPTDKFAITAACVTFPFGCSLELNNLCETHVAVGVIIPKKTFC